MAIYLFSRPHHNNECIRCKNLIETVRLSPHSREIYEDITHDSNIKIFKDTPMTIIL